MSETTTTETKRQHTVNPATGNCVMCGRNQWNRERHPECDYKPRAPQPALDAGETKHWKREAPTEPGWYWFKHDPFIYPDLPAPIAAPKLLMIYSDEKVMRAEDTVNMESHFANEMLGYWSGPLAAPEFDGDPAAAIAQGKE